MNFHKLTIEELNQGFIKKQFSVREVTRFFLDRIDKKDSKIDSFLLVLEKNALNQADKIDEQIRNNEKIGILSGIPYGMKDILVTKDITTTAGSKILKNFVPPYSATVYEKLLNAGSIMLGKTNMDEFAMGGSTENSAFKTTKNPWNTKKVPGGSSGGSAAALASSFCSFSIGTDTGGSIRQPASFCGVVGIKPTYGRVSRYGLISLASSLDQVGTFTKNVSDGAIVLNEISGHDSRDSTSVSSLKTDFQSFLTGDIKGLKIGVPKEFFGKGVDEEIALCIKKAISGFEKQGAKVEEISLPTSIDSLAVYYIILPSEASANLARFDGIRFGHSRDLFGPEVKRRIMLGTYALSSGYFDAYYLKAAKVRTLISQEFQNAFKKVDLIVGPTSPILPFNIGEKIDDPLAMYLADIMTIPVNLAGLPAVSIPCGLVKNMPVGMQLIGNHWEEGKILKAAYTFEKNYPQEFENKLEL